MEKLVCKKCGRKLEHFSGQAGVPEHYYCPKCMDWAYNEKGEKIAPLE